MHDRVLDARVARKQETDGKKQWDIKRNNGGQCRDRIRVMLYDKNGRPKRALAELRAEQCELGDYITLEE